MKSYLNRAAGRLVELGIPGLQREMHNFATKDGTQLKAALAWSRYWGAREETGEGQEARKSLSRRANRLSQKRVLG